jgi:predicted PurR-regulated permease PerM
MDNTQSESTAWRAVYAVVVVLVVAAFFYSVRLILNPFLLFLLVLVLASPFARERSHRMLILVVASLTVIWLLATVGSLLGPFFLALGLAYVLFPLVRKIERRGVGRGLAIALLFLPLLVGIGLLVAFGVPALGRQIGDLINGAPRALESLVAWAERMQAKLVQRDLPFIDEQALVAKLHSIRPEAVLAYLQGRQAQIARSVWGTLVGAGRGVGLLLNVLGYLFLAPILIYYLLRDWEGIHASAVGLIPLHMRPGMVAFFREYDRLLAGYIRGNLLESAIVGTLTFLGLWALGIPFALLLGVTAAVFNLIPYIGLILTLIPALGVALFTGDILMSMLKVGLVFALVQSLDGAIIGPKVVGDSVELHPVWVILSISVFGFFWGLVGLLLAVPLAVLVKMLLGVAVARYRRSAVYVSGNA